MTDVAKRLLEEALELSLDERAQLAGRLLESLDAPADDDVEAVWSEEIRHRVAALDAGTVQPVAWDEAKVMIFGDQDAADPEA